MLRGGIDITQQPSGIAVASSNLERSFVSLEIEVQNPIAYPFLAPIHGISTNQDTLSRLTQSRGGSSALPLCALLPIGCPHVLTTCLGIPCPLNRA